MATLAAAGLGCQGGVPQDDWRARTEVLMVQGFCEPAMYFRQCFDIDEETCTRVARDTIRRCMGQAEIPDHLDTVSGGRVGREVGACAGLAFETELAAKRRSNAKCDDPMAWTK
jgi:hypothetical protein